jgi:hypothetical protein
MEYSHKERLAMKPFSPNLTPEPWPPVPAGWADIPFAEKLMLCIAAAVAMAVGILGWMA